jgi:hypothetical protein
VWLKAAPGAQADLVDADPELFFVPPYVGPKGWIGIHLDGRQVDWKALGAHIAASYRLIAPKTLAARLGGAEPRKGARRRR